MFKEIMFDNVKFNCHAKRVRTKANPQSRTKNAQNNKTQQPFRINYFYVFS